MPNENKHVSGAIFAQNVPPPGNAPYPVMSGVAWFRAIESAQTVEPRLDIQYGDLRQVLDLMSHADLSTVSGWINKFRSSSNEDYPCGRLAPCNQQGRQSYKDFPAVNCVLHP